MSQSQWTYVVRWASERMVLHVFLAVCHTSLDHTLNSTLYVFTDKVLGTLLLYTMCVGEMFTDKYGIGHGYRHTHNDLDQEIFEEIIAFSIFFHLQLNEYPMELFCTYFFSVNTCSLLTQRQPFDITNSGAIFSQEKKCSLIHNEHKWSHKLTNKR